MQNGIYTDGPATKGNSPRPIWKRVLDVASPLFVIYWFYFLMSATHDNHTSVRRYMLNWPNWKAKFVLYTVLLCGLAAFWTIALLIRSFPNAASKAVPKLGSSRHVVAVLVVAIVGALLLKIGIRLLGS